MWAYIIISFFWNTASAHFNIILKHSSVISIISVDPVCAQRRGPNPIVCEMVSKYGCCGKKCLQHGCLAERGCMATETIATPVKVRPELRESHLENIKRMFEITGAPCKHVGACSLTLSSSYFLLTFLLLFWLISQLPPPFFSHSLPSLWGALCSPPLISVHLPPSLPASLTSPSFIHPCLLVFPAFIYLSISLAASPPPFFIFTCIGGNLLGHFLSFPPRVSPVLLSCLITSQQRVWCLRNWADPTWLVSASLSSSLHASPFFSPLNCLSFYIYFSLSSISPPFHPLPPFIIFVVSLSLFPLSLFLSSSILVSPPFIRLSHSDIWFIYAPFLFFSQLCLSLSLP